MATWTNIASSLAPATGGAVPTRPEQLSAEWLTTCLSHAGVLEHGARVRSFEQKRIGQGRGYAGQLARVSLEYEPADAGPRTLIAKFATEHAATRQMMSGVSGYQREVRFYRELASSVGVPTPRCYFAHYDEAASRFCLLLEDLAPAASIDMERGLDFEQGKLVLEQLATLHARWWNRTHEVPWLGMTEELLANIRSQFIAAVPGFRSEYGTRYPVTARVARQLALMLRDDRLLKSTTAPPLTFSHNDLHLENVFFPSADGGHFAIIDWQSISSTRHGTGDVSRILCVGMTPEVRRKHQSALLAHYHARLSELGVRDFSLRKLKQRFRQEMAATVMIGVLAFETLDFDFEGGRRMVEVMGERVEETLRDSGVLYVLAIWSPFYRLRYFWQRAAASRPRAVGALGRLLAHAARFFRRR